MFRLISCSIFSLLIAFSLINSIFADSKLFKLPKSELIRRIKSRTNIHINQQSNTSNTEDKLRNILLSNYIQTVIPVENHTHALTLSLELIINHIDINDIDSRATFHGYLNLQWHDMKLKWDPNEFDGLDSIYLQIDELWTPDISLYNTVNAILLPLKHEGMIRLSSNGTIDWQPHVQLETHCNLKLKYWPLDEQKCSVVFGSWVHSGHKMKYATIKNLPILDLISKNHNWNIVKTHSFTWEKIYACCPEPYPSITFIFEIERKSSMLCWLIITPIIAIVLMCLASFWIPSYRGEKLILNSFNLLLTTFYINYFVQKLPSQSEEIPLIMIFMISTFILLTNSMILSVILLKITRTSNHTNNKTNQGLDRVLHENIFSRILCLPYAKGNKSDKDQTELKDQIEDGKSKEIKSEILAENYKIEHYVTFGYESKWTSAEENLRKALLDNYMRTVIPVENHTHTLTLNISLMVHHMEIDDIDTKATLHGLLQLEWHDKKLQWNPNDFDGLDDIYLKIDNLWRPDLSLYNTANGNLLNLKHEGTLKISSNGKIDWTPHIKLETYCYLNLKKWPFDVQKCSFIFGSWVHSGNKLQPYLSFNKPILNILSKNHNWIITDTISFIEETYYACCPESYPTITFTFDLVRRSPMLCSLIVIPLIVIVLICMCGFWIASNRSEKILLNGFNLLMCTLYIHCFVQKLPHHLDEIPSIVIFQIATYILLIISILLSVVVMRISKNSGKLNTKLNDILQSNKIQRIFCLPFNTANNVQKNQITELKDNFYDGKSADNNLLINNKYYLDDNANDWILLATLLDRIFFHIYLFLFTIIFLIIFI